MKQITASEWTPGMEAWLWVEAGDGALLLVTDIRADWWIVTGYSSWCSTPGDRLYVGSEPEARDLEAKLRAELANRRANWRCSIPSYC